MAAQAWYVGLDLGPRTFTAAAAVRGRDGDVAALGCETVLAAGVERGVLVDPAVAARTVASLLERVSRRLAADVRAVSLTISGSPCRRVASSAERRLGAASWFDAAAMQRLRLETLRVPAATGTVLASASWARVDGRRWPDGEPVAWGQRLRVDTQAWVVPPGFVAGYLRVLSSLGLELDLIMPRVAAAARVALAASELTEGALAVDVGESETDVVVYLGGAVRALFTVPHGYANVGVFAGGRSLLGSGTATVGSGPTGASVVGLGRPYSSVAALDGAARGLDDAPALDPLRASPLGNLFRQTRRRLEELDLYRPLRGGVLVGESARRSEVSLAAARALGLPVRVGRPLGWQGGQGCADPTLAPAIGLVLAQAHVHAEDAASQVPESVAPEASRARRQGQASGLGRWLREFVPAGDGS